MIKYVKVCLCGLQRVLLSGCGTSECSFTNELSLILTAYLYTERLVYFGDFFSFLFFRTALYAIAFRMTRSHVDTQKFVYILWPPAQLQIGCLFTRKIRKNVFSKNEIGIFFVDWFAFHFRLVALFCLISGQR